MPMEFRFQSILDLRKRTEEERQMALALSLQQMVALRGQKERLQAEQLRIGETIKTTLRGALDARMLEQNYRYLYSLDQEILRVGEEIQRAEEDVARQRQLLADAMKERKTMEKLKDQDRQAVLDAYRHKEQETLDDLNVARYARQM